jgi:hypothetical protein
MASGTPRKNNLRVGLILLAATLLYMGALIGYMITR